jgi:hypothetical protein
MPQKLSISVATTVTQVLPPRAGRTFIILQNLSDVAIYLDFTSDATALTVANGYRLDAGDTLIIDNIREGGFTNGVEAIHGGTGTKELRVQEE